MVLQVVGNSYVIDNLNYISQLGYDAALVGTSLMKTKVPGIALAELLNRVPA